MLGRYVGATIVILGVAMLMAPDAPDRETRRAAAEEERRAAAPIIERPITVSVADPTDPVPAPAPSPTNTSAPTVSEVAIAPLPAEEAPAETTSEEAAASLALGLSGQQTEDYVLPTFEEPATLQEASLTGDTLALLSVLEEAETSEEQDAPADSASAVSEPQPQAQPSILYVTGSRVNVRAGPSTGFDVISSVAFGDAVELLADAGDGWAEIRLAGGDTGFMSRQFLEE